MLAKLEEIFQPSAEQIEAEKSKPPPETVLAYRDVFGKWPEGWPPWGQD